MIHIFDPERKWSKEILTEVGGVSIDAQKKAIQAGINKCNKDKELDNLSNLLPKTKSQVTIFFLF